MFSQRGQVREQIEALEHHADLGTLPRQSAVAERDELLADLPSRRSGCR